tara:strand:+ start:2343 stop:2585 length:243 start_codon:yes stop_codon:yes gene_type:complete
MRKKHYIVTEEGWKRMKYETIEEFKDEIPMLMAITESGFAEEDWLAVTGKGKRHLTREEYESFMKEISTSKKRNTELMGI